MLSCINGSQGSWGDKDDVAGGKSKHPRKMGKVKQAIAAADASEKLKKVKRLAQEFQEASVKTVKGGFVVTPPPRPKPMKASGAQRRAPGGKLSTAALKAQADREEIHETVPCRECTEPIVVTVGDVANRLRYGPYTSPNYCRACKELRRLEDVRLIAEAKRLKPSLPAIQQEQADEKVAALEKASAEDSGDGPAEEPGREVSVLDVRGEPGCEREPPPTEGVHHPKAKKRRLFVVETEGYVRIPNGAGHLYYKHTDSVMDGSVKRRVFQQFDPHTQAYNSMLLPLTVGLIDDGQYGFFKPTSDLGAYESGECMMKAVSALMCVKDFVVEARAHRWFRKLRCQAIDFLNTVSFDAWYKRTFVYRGLTKVTRDVIVDKTLLGYLVSNRSNMTIGSLQNRHLATPTLERFSYIPHEIILDTLLYFGEFRTAWQSQLLATTAAQEAYLLSGNVSRFKWREPTPASVVKEMVHDEHQPGVYEWGDWDGCIKWFKKGYTSIMRIPYTASDPSHGSASNPTIPPGGRFEVVSATEGSGFADPYIFFPQRYDPKTSATSPHGVQYQTVGGCFGTKMAVVEKNQTEFEKCVIRLTSARPGEFALRGQQAAALGDAYRTALESRPDDHKLLTETIQTFCDKKYEEAIPMPGSCAPFSRNLAAALLARSNQPFSDDELEAFHNWFKAVREYIRDTGVKIPQREQAVKDLEDAINLSSATSFKNSGDQKPHEAQKVKEGILKYARLFIAIVGKDWAMANPLMAKYMKASIETPVIVENGVMRMGTFEKRVGNMQDFWYRTVLHETSLDDLAAVISTMILFAEDHPNCVVGISHGDDMLVLQVINSVHHWIEGDISSCDISHTSPLFRLLYSECLERGYDPLTAFVQLANPVRLVNPLHKGDRVVLRSLHGEIMPTGCILTTYINSFASFLIILMHATYPHRTLEVNAAEVGYIVTTVHGPLEKMTFLSKAFYHDPRTGIVKAFTDIASLIRSFGRKTGDLEGSSRVPVCQRFTDYIRGVTKGFVHEPKSAILRELTRISERVESPLHESAPVDLEEIDEAIVERYTFDGIHWEGDIPSARDAYTALIKRLRSIKCFFGKYIVDPFVDSILKKRYGLGPMTASNGLAGRGLAVSGRWGTKRSATMLVLPHHSATSPFHACGDEQL